MATNTLIVCTQTTICNVVLGSIISTIRNVSHDYLPNILVGIGAGREPEKPPPGGFVGIGTDRLVPPIMPCIPGGFVGIGTDRIPEGLNPPPGGFVGIGTDFVGGPNCLGEMFDTITYLGLPCLDTQMLQNHNHRMDVVIGG
jgi:hypothetical protein